MWERLLVSVVFLLLTGASYAQWTKKDSLELKKLLESEEELKLNDEAVRQIKFKNEAELPRMLLKKRWMRIDESLPRATPPSTMVELDSLRKPIYGRLPMDTLRITMVIKLPPPEGISLGNGVRVNGGLFTGLDLLQVFTKDFWQFRKKRMRAGTMHALENYRNSKR